jgi:hypothetical protein
MLRFKSCVHDDGRGRRASVKPGSQLTLQLEGQAKAAAGITAGKVAVDFKEIAADRE